MKPLNETEQFLIGTFRMPDPPPTEGPIPARLSALPRDRSPLPEGVWLRFQNFGSADKFKSWSAQMQIDEQGDVYLVTHLGDSTPDKVKKPAWPTKPQQELDAALLAQMRKEAAAFAAGPAYRGHEGLSYAPTFVVTVRDGSGEKELFLEGFEDDFIKRLRRTTIFALKTPLDGKAPKQPAKKP